MNEFDQWRTGYGSRTIEQEIEYHNDLERRYPDQAHYNLKAAKEAFSTCMPHQVIEAGAWKGDLAKAILSENAKIKSWTAYEICTEAIRKTVCTDSRFTYILPEKFNWFLYEQVFSDIDMFLATHFIEHLSNTDLVSLTKALRAANVRSIYFEAPLTDEGSTWEGYEGTHMLEMGWNEIERLLPGYYEHTLAPGCKLYIK
jgi:hypothetical protein